MYQLECSKLGSTLDLIETANIVGEENTHFAPTNLEKFAQGFGEHDDITLPTIDKQALN